MASKSSHVDTQSSSIPALLQSNYVRIVDASHYPAMSSPGPQGGVPVIMLANSTQIPNDRNMTYTSRNSRPIVSGLSNKVYDLSSLMQMSSSPARARSATEPVSPSLTTNSPLSQLLSLLPRKRRRLPGCGEGEEAFEGDDSSEREEHEARKSRHKPNLKKIDEVSHLGRHERKVGVSAPLYFPARLYQPTLGIRKETR